MKKIYLFKNTPKSYVHFRFYILEWTYTFISTFQNHSKKRYKKKSKKGKKTISTTMKTGRETINRKEF